MATEAPATPNVQPQKSEPEPIPVYDRLVLWMFVAGIVMFALLLLGDMFIGLLQ